MDNWQAAFLGLRQLPRELTTFEIEAFFTFTPAERQVIGVRVAIGRKTGLSQSDLAGTCRPLQSVGPLK
jgi:hypothetical protein